MTNKRKRKGRQNVGDGMGELFKHSSAPPKSGIKTVRPVAVPLSVDLDKYRHHLNHLDMPEERKTELLLSLRTIMRSFVDRAFGDDPVQQCRKHVDETQAEDETAIPPVIHLGDDPTDPDKDLSTTFRHHAGKRRTRESDRS